MTLLFDVNKYMSDLQSSDMRHMWELMSALTLVSARRSEL